MMCGRLESRRVFIASPCDLVDERLMFPQVLDEVNKIKANPQGLHLEPVGWEDTLPGKGRPQELINRELETCDLVVMLLWKRWGTNTGRYSSGFEEEYELAKSHNKASGKPELWLYFRSIPSDMLSDQGPQLRKVVRFRKKIEARREFLYSLYETLEQWQSTLRGHLCKWIDGPPLPSALPTTPRTPQTNDALEARLAHLSAQLDRTLELLLSEAQRHAHSGQLTRAEELFSQVVALSPNPAALNEYGSFLFDIGMMQKAEQKFTELLRSAQITQDRATEAVATGNLGLIQQSRGHLAAAEEMHKKTLAIVEQLGLREAMANSYGNLGNLYETRGDLDAAEKMHKKSLAIEQELGRREGIAADYVNLGLVYQTRGDLDTAEDMFKKALAIDEQLGRQEGIAADYANLANIEATRRNLDAAEDMHKKSIAIYEQLGRQEGIANECGNLGNIYSIRGDLKAAEEMYQKVLCISQQLGLRLSMATCYSNLGNLHSAHSNMDTAEEMYKKALAIGQELGAREHMACSYHNLGRLHLTRGKPEAALQALTESLRLFALVGATAMVRRLETEIGELKTE